MNKIDKTDISLPENQQWNTSIGLDDQKFGAHVALTNSGGYSLALGFDQISSQSIYYDLSQDATVDGPLTIHGQTVLVKRTDLETDSYTPYITIKPAN